MNALKVFLKKSSKTEALATIFHDEGLNFLRQRKYFEALKSYNKSLCYAKPNSVDFVNGFVSRSVVYFEMQHYQKCLENIKLARLQPTYETNESLDELESRCKDNLILDNEINTDGRFKLSYAPHQRLPFIANCIELSENEKFGRYIKTNRNLAPGDIIAIEKPFLRFIDFQSMNFFKYQRCFNCLKSNQLNLLPGPHKVMSCSQDCYNSILENEVESDTLSELDWKIAKMIRIKDYSLSIAGSVEKLEELTNLGRRTIFDFDLNNLGIELQENLLKCTISLIGGTAGKVDNNIELFKLIIGSYDKQQRDFLVKYVEHLMNVCRKTQFSLNIFNEVAGQFEKIGNCLLPFGGLLNHSCDPNLFWIPAEGQFVYIVAKPVRAGEQLFICYRKTFLRERLADRQKALWKQYGFKCDCSACSHDYRISGLVDDLQIDQFNNINTIREEVSRNWVEIERNFDKQSPYKTAEIVAKNKFLLELVGSKFI